VAYGPVHILAANGQTVDWALVVEELWGKVLSPWLRLSLMGPLILVPAVAVRGWPCDALSTPCSV
jgi:hypothetical protein